MRTFACEKQNRITTYEKEDNESVMPMANPADGGLPGGLLPEEGTEEHCSPKGED